MNKKKIISTQLKVIVTREALHIAHANKAKQQNEFNAMEMIANIYNRYYSLMSATKHAVRAYFLSSIYFFRSQFTITDIRKKKSSNGKIFARKTMVCSAWLTTNNNEAKNE